MKRIWKEDKAIEPVPDLEAKLAGEQTPRGWGLFLIKSMVDEMHVINENDLHTVELLITLQPNGHSRR